MKKKNKSLKKLAPVPAAAAVFALAASAAHGQTWADETTLFSANFPASWNGTSTTVVNEGGTAPAGFQSGTATYTTSFVPPGAAAGTGSMGLSASTSGGIKVTPNGALLNPALANDGGFAFNVDFMWNGGFSSANSYTQKLIDYAGTESLQIIAKSATSATLEMAFANNTGVETDVDQFAINPNTWYNASMIFNTYGAALNADGSLTGTSFLYINGTEQAYGTATKGTYGDGLASGTQDRPIAIGELGYGHTTSLVGFDGDIYSASIDVAPEPSTLALGALGGLGLLGLRWRFRRGKAGA